MDKKVQNYNNSAENYWQQANCQKEQKCQNLWQRIQPSEGIGSEQGDESEEADICAQFWIWNQVVGKHLKGPTMWD